MNSENKGIVEIKVRERLLVLYKFKMDCEQSWSLKLWTHCDFSQHKKVKGGVKLDDTLGLCFFLEDRM